MNTLRYSKNEGEILESDFESMPEFLNALALKVNQEKVYLVGVEIESIDEVFVSDKADNCFKFIEALVSETETNADIFFFEFPSYEEAYKVALAMQEPKPLCYNK